MNTGKQQIKWYDMARIRRSIIHIEFNIKKNLSDTDIVRIKKIVSDYGLVPTKAFIEDYANRCRTSLDILPYSDHWKAVFSDLIEYLM